MQLPQVLQFSAITIIFFCVVALVLIRQGWARNHIVLYPKDAWDTVFIASFLLAVIGIAASIIWRVQVEMVGGGL